MTQNPRDLIELPRRGPECPSTRTLQSLLGRSEAHASADLQGHLERCTECGGYVDRLRTAQAEFQRARPAERFLRQLEVRTVASERSATRSRRWRWTLIPLGLVAAALIPVLLLRPASMRPASESIRWKGVRFQAFYLRDGMTVPEPVVPDMELRTGDRLRFVYVSPEPGELAILSLDGTGTPTVFHPYGEGRSRPFMPMGTEPLPGSIELDTAPGPELLIAVFRRKPFDLGPLLERLKGKDASGAISIGCPDCVIDTLRIQKVP